MGLFGSIAKGLFGGKTKKAQTNVKKNEVSVENPWAPVAQPLQDYLTNTTALYNNTPLFSPEELAANEQYMNAVTQGQADLDAAIAENNKTLSGAYLTPDTNPYLADIGKRVSGLAGAQQSATFGGRGRTGGGLAGYYSGKATTDSLTDLYGNAYAAERGRMGQAVGYAPTLAKGGTDLAEGAVTLGQGITNRPLERNATYGGILSELGKMGGTKTTDTTGVEKVYGKSSGLLGSIFNAAANKVFGTSFRTN